MLVCVYVSSLNHIRIEWYVRAHLLPEISSQYLYWELKMCRIITLNRLWRQTSPRIYHNVRPIRCIIVTRIVCEVHTLVTMEHAIAVCQRYFLSVCFYVPFWCLLPSFLRHSAPIVCYRHFLTLAKYSLLFGRSARTYVLYINYCPKRHWSRRQCAKFCSLKCARDA